MQHRAERDQAGRQIADGRAVGYVAADRAGIADLVAGKAAQHLAEIRVNVGEDVAGLAMGDRRAEIDPAAGLLDHPQVADMADVDQGRQLTMLLGDPEADIGRAGDQHGVGILGIEVSEIVDIGRREPAAPILLIGKDRVALDDAQAAGEHRVLCPRVGHGLGGQIEPGIDDRTVAGAAAQIAGDQVLHRCPVRDRAGQPARMQLHDEARRAEAALAAVTLDHRGLHRMRPVASDMLHGLDRAPVHCRQKLDAGVHRAAMQAAGPVGFGQKHRAGTAIALGAAFLGAGQPLGAAQIFQQRRRRRDALDGAFLAVEDEADRPGGDRRHQLPR